MTTRPSKPLVRETEPRVYIGVIRAGRLYLSDCDGKLTGDILAAAAFPLSFAHKLQNHKLRVYEAGNCAIFNEFLAKR